MQYLDKHGNFSIGSRGNLACANGEAWLRNGSNEGWVLSSNGTWYYDDDMDGVTWSANGNTLTLSDGNSTET